MLLNKALVVLFFSTITLQLYGQAKLRGKDTMALEILEEVIVSATRTRRQLSSLPLPADLVSKKEIQTTNSQRLSDILSEQTGLTTVPDFGGGEGIQLQGMDAQYTLILIDGAPLIGRSAGTLDLSRIAVGNVAQIEIVKGASSSLYGNDALGGVINIITENPKDGFKGTFQNRYGSFSSNDTGLHLSYKTKKFALGTFFNRLHSEGYDLNDADNYQTVEPYRNNTINTKFSYVFSKKSELLISARYFTQLQDYNASEELQGESEIKEWNTHAKFDYRLNSKWKSHFEFYASRYKTHEFLNEGSSTYSESDFNQLLWRPELRSSYTPNKKTTFVGGVGISVESISRTDFITVPTFTSPYVYLQYDTNLTDRLNVLTGARFDNHNIYKSQLSPKGAIRYQLTDKVALKASAGYGFKAPDFRQLYFNFSNATVGYTVLGYNAVQTEIPRLQAQNQINTIIVPTSEFQDGLKAENSLSINLGVDYKPFSQLSLNFNFFRNNINDLIDTRVIASKTNGQNIFSYYNINQVYTQGIEFNSKWKLTDLLTLNGGYQLLYAMDKNARNDFSKDLVFARETPTSPAFTLKKNDYFGLFNRSRHMANLKLFYDIPKWTMDANIRATYRSKYALTDTNGNNYLDAYDTFIKGYSILDMAINKVFLKKHKVGFGIDNILGFTDTQNISTIPGRIIYGKITIHI
ncbi:TonB-dependent receptor [uncultured Kriegella sp.]|uniref:TonB-dependent receptor plug domain-containing protein n=1 Tax=uncultured Kriegella sp. TaxID=1798910 RepID=UPI0030D91115|tara:strand:- start:100174 stop:102249 length:2076 start_codon:yes stop_codon:yes gene_type:complete